VEKPEPITRRRVLRSVAGHTKRSDRAAKAVGPQCANAANWRWFSRNARGRLSAD